MASLGVLGMFGNVIFTACSAQVLTFRDLNITRQSRFAWHNVIGSEPVPEFVGPDSARIRFNVTLSSQFSSPPITYIEVLKNMVESGESYMLILGADYIGRCVLESFSEDRKYWGAYGIPIWSDVSLNVRTAESFSLTDTLTDLISSAVDTVTDLLS